MAIGGRFMRRFMGTRSVRSDCFCARDILQGCVFCRHCQAADIGRGRLPEAGIQD